MNCSAMSVRSASGEFDFSRLDREGDAVAQLFVEHREKARGLCRFGGEAMDLARLAQNFRRVTEVDRRPPGEIGEGRARHRQLLGGQFGAQAQHRHHRVHAQVAVEVGAADAHAAVGEDVVAAFGPAAASGADADDGKIRGAAADVGDHDQFLARGALLVLRGGGDGFVDERDVGVAGLAGECCERGFGERVGGVVAFDEAHRAAVDDGVDGRAQRFFGFQFRDGARTWR